MDYLVELKNFAIAVTKTDWRFTRRVLNKYKYLNQNLRPENGWSSQSLIPYIENIENHVQLIPEITKSLSQQFIFRLGKLEYLKNTLKDDIHDVLSKYRKKVHEYDIVIARLLNDIVNYDVKIGDAQKDGNWGRYETYTAGWAKTDTKIQRLQAEKAKILKMLSGD